MATGHRSRDGSTRWRDRFPWLALRLPFQPHLCSLLASSFATRRNAIVLWRGAGHLGRWRLVTSVFDTLLILGICHIPYTAGPRAVNPEFLDWLSPANPRPKGARAGWLGRNEPSTERGEMPTETRVGWLPRAGKPKCRTAPRLTDAGPPSRHRLQCLQSDPPKPGYTSSAKRIRKVLDFIQFGGAGGIRTPYLLTASQTLSQLSYSPTAGLGS